MSWIDVICRDYRMVLVPARTAPRGVWAAAFAYPSAAEIDGVELMVGGYASGVLAQQLSARRAGTIGYASEVAASEPQGRHRAGALDGCCGACAGGSVPGFRLSEGWLSDKLMMSQPHEAPRAYVRMQHDSPDQLRLEISMARTAPDRAPWLRVKVSRQQYDGAAIRTSAAIRQQLKKGAQNVLVDTEGQVLELDDADLVSAGQSWTLRIVGQSNVRIHLETPLPRTAQLVATDASFVEATGYVTLHAYTRATVHAFDHCVVYARNRVTVLACDQASVCAQDEVEVFAYDLARVRVKGHSTAVCAGMGELFVEDQASGLVSANVTVGGPSQGNVGPLPH